MIKTILFDLDDTILDFKESERIALSKTLTDLGITPTDEIISMYSRFNISQWKRLELGEITREEVKVNRYQLLFDAIGVNVSPKKATDIYEDHLANGHYFIDGAVEMLESIYRDYDMYIVSNGSKKVQDGRLSTANLDRFFKGVFISEVVGAEKPSEIFFNNVFSAIEDFDKSTAVIIGDSLSSDIKGGKNAGIKTIWYNKKKEKPSDIIPDYEVNDLSQIKELLDTL